MIIVNQLTFFLIQLENYIVLNLLPISQFVTDIWILMILDDRRQYGLRWFYIRVPLIIDPLGGLDAMVHNIRSSGRQICTIYVKIKIKIDLKLFFLIL